MDTEQRQRVEQLLAELEDMSCPANTNTAHIHNLKTLLTGESEPGPAQALINAATIYMDDFIANTWAQDEKGVYHAKVTCGDSKTMRAWMPLSILIGLRRKTEVCPVCGSLCSPDVKDDGILLGDGWKYRAGVGWKLPEFKA